MNPVTVLADFKRQREEQDRYRAETSRIIEQTIWIERATRVLKFMFWVVAATVSLIWLVS